MSNVKSPASVGSASDLAHRLLAEPATPSRRVPFTTVAPYPFIRQGAIWRL